MWSMPMLACIDEWQAREAHHSGFDRGQTGVESRVELAEGMLSVTFEVGPCHWLDRAPCEAAEVSSILDITCVGRWRRL